MNLMQQLINGLVLGHAYALVAIGWTLLLGVARLVNFGHGQMYMLGAFVTWWAVTKAGVPYALALPLAMAIGALFGLVMQRVMLKATLEQNLVSIMIMTLGFGYVLNGGAALVFGSTLVFLACMAGPMIYTNADYIHSEFKLAVANILPSYQGEILNNKFYVKVIDFMLLLPVDSQFAVSTRQFGMDNLVNAFVGVCIVVFSLVKLHVVPGIAQVALYFAAIALGVAVHYSIMFFLSTMSFPCSKKSWMLTTILLFARSSSTIWISITRPGDAE